MMNNFFKYLIVCYEIIENGETKYIAEIPNFQNCTLERVDKKELMKLCRKAIEVNIIEQFISKGVIESPEKIDDNEMSNWKEHKYEIIEQDFSEYILAIKSNKKIKKTVTIPEWLNAYSGRFDLNYSQILENGIKTELLTKDFGLSEDEKKLLHARIFD